MSAKTAKQAAPTSSAAALEATLRRAYAMQTAGDADGAAAIYRHVLESCPDETRALTLLAAIEATRGDRGEAKRLFEAALRADPKARAPRLQLTAIALQDNDPERALGLIRRYTEAFPKDPKGWSLRGRAAQASGGAQEAVASFAEAEATGDARAAGPLGKALEAVGDYAQAVAAYRRLLVQNPNNATVHAAIGAAFDRMGRRQEASESYQRAIVLDPTNWEAQAALGFNLNRTGQFDAAADAYGLALPGAAHKADVLNNIGNCRLSQGRPRLARSIYRQALAADPANIPARRNLCMATAYDDGATSDDLAAACRASVADLKIATRPQLRVGNDGPLRVGFVSADFRHHSVSAFVEPLFANAATHGIDVHAYSLVQTPDKVTARLRDRAAVWRDAADWTTAEAVRRIRADDVDILIDLAGQTSEARFDIFAARPAPVQASWLGWPATTGLTAIDFKISDRLLTPAETTETLVEAPLNLAGPALCFQPPDEAPPIAPAPILTRGAPTFGSFNRVFKASPTTLKLWAAAMAAVPDARLVLKNSAFGCPVASDHFLQRLAAVGIAPARVTLMNALATRAQHLAVYDDIDIALDSAPYNGVTTTCEALWMGVPTVTIAGDQALARYGLSVMTHAGLPEYVAEDQGEFAEIVRRLVAEPERLAARRRTMRHRMTASPLMDGSAFAESFAQGCRTMLDCIRRQTA